MNRTERIMKRVKEHYEEACSLGKEVVAVNKFRDAMVGEGEKFSNGTTRQTLIIERGNKGVVIVNLKDGVEQINHKVGLADGEYIDHANGINFKVKDGILTGKIKASKIAVIY